MKHATIRSAALDALAHSSQTPIALEMLHDNVLLSAGGLGISSVALLQAFVSLEGAYGITFDDAKVLKAKFHTVGDFVAFMESTLPASS